MLDERLLGLPHCFSKLSEVWALVVTILVVGWQAALWVAFLSSCRDGGCQDKSYCSVPD